MKSLVKLIDELDHFTIGWAIDAEQGNTYLDISFAAVPGTSLAQQAAEMRDTKSGFAGFLQPDAAAVVNFSGSIPEEDSDQLIAMLSAVQSRATQAIDEDEDLPDDAARAVLKSALDDD